MLFFENFKLKNKFIVNVYEILPQITKTNKSSEVKFI